MTVFEANLRGIGYLLVSIVAFILNDTLIKLVSARLPPGEILVLRGGFALAIILVLLVMRGDHRQWRLAVSPLIAWRTVGEVGTTIFYLYALFHMPIANVSAIAQIVPLMTTAAAAIFLGEAVGRPRWLAIAVGFVGVMIIMRPGLDGFDAYSLAALASMALVSMRDLLTRRLPAALPTLLVTAISTGAVALSGIALSFSETWPAPSGEDLMLLAAAGSLLLVGYGTVILAMRYGEMSVMAPFRYSVILFAIALGYGVWGDVPDTATILGTVIVVGSGLFTLDHERRLARRLAMQTSG